MDSKSLLDSLSTSHDPKYRRLKIDVAALREVFNNGELSAVCWVPGKAQLADALTKNNGEVGEKMNASRDMDNLLASTAEIRIRKSQYSESKRFTSKKRE